MLYAANDVPQPIPDLGSAVSHITVPSLGAITALRVIDLRGTHTYLGDLTATLEPPTGASLTLFADACGSADDFDVDFADDAGVPLLCPATDGLAHLPADPLGSLNGLPTGGTWTLRIDDQAAFDSGTLLGWGLLICASEITCPSAPDPACRTAQKSGLLLRDTTGTNDKLLWKWIKGEATSQLDLSNPLDASDYELCVYGGSAKALLIDLTVAPDPLKWKATSRGYKYKDRLGTAGGVNLIIAKAGGAGRAKAVVKANGPNLLLPPLAALSPPVTVQLHNASQNLCWGSEFDLSQVLIDTSAQFKAKAP